jgi:hypothetical protein
VCRQDVVHGVRHPTNFVKEPRPVLDALTAGQAAALIEQIDAALQKIADAIGDPVILKYQPADLHVLRQRYLSQLTVLRIVAGEIEQRINATAREALGLNATYVELAKALDCSKQSAHQRFRRVPIQGGQLRRRWFDNLDPQNGRVIEIRDLDHRWVVLEYQGSAMTARAHKICSSQEEALSVAHGWLGDATRWHDAMQKAFPLEWATRIDETKLRQDAWSWDFTPRDPTFKSPKIKHARRRRGPAT